MIALPGRRASMESPAGAPSGLPVPGRFAHLHPDDGACLMEAAALLAAGRFTDSPAGTHPALAALARVVNDNVGDDTRHALWPLAADLADARPASRAYPPLLVGTVVDAARRVHPSSRRLARNGRACRRRAERLAGAPVSGPAVRIADLLWWRGPGRRRLEQALRVLCAAPEADRLLSRLLRQAVTQAREYTGVPAASREIHCNR
ncbi:hypothetical protein RFN57_01650 [Streptomyces violaceochromogenes]|uniref:Uncharacterized protein n=1 Tax=Streptomyces violaceochromogenes TaxID=67377 RepID=A0ABU6LQW1_9ACTN|nr:hypothetical protein [Streptomyces violaceochromogenes]MEC7051022.1 hypothetical protein [Streptomyces violaceochromogenes]GHC86119.1 hypothetical protein GCM10010309_65210 [Streptomyces violaceochromogenes]